MLERDQASRATADDDDFHCHKLAVVDCCRQRHATLTLGTIVFKRPGPVRSVAARSARGASTSPKSDIALAVATTRAFVCS